ncbi:hypothetical protein EG339_11815 [Chryseobacterium bernardetii]|uniref:DUF4252 domain-containing protein n=1 Tax=Chryseobacterium bernardetii TaxID=1241978 RepID=A0A3G6TEV0_9FLAO|nr:hypothetical protein [Chryseobacterium bernardetii]AZB25216.1 hypothetical protein EG339_11815 [Chryseobacterium bernardetii]
MKIKVWALLLIVPIFSLKAQNKNKTHDYLNIPDPIKLNLKEYNLVWSSHPNDNYFKQEYLSSDEDIDKYNSMVLIEFIKGDFNLKDVIDQKVAELQEIKKSNPIVNYEIFESNNGEYILDFLVSKNSKDGQKILIAERNIYRYILIKNKGVLLFALSERGYEKNMEDFFKDLKANSFKLVEFVGIYKLPDIEIK